MSEALAFKFWSVWRDGLVFWSGAHMVVFLMPIWWLQPIADKLFTLAFNTYLSLRAYEDDDDETPLDDESPLTGGGAADVAQIAAR